MPPSVSISQRTEVEELLRFDSGVGGWGVGMGWAACETGFIRLSHPHSSVQSTGLPTGRGHGRQTQNRQFKNKSGRGKLPAAKAAVSG